MAITFERTMVDITREGKNRKQHYTLLQHFARRAGEMLILMKYDNIFLLRKRLEKENQSKNESTKTLLRTIYMIYITSIGNRN